jgi:hypothetical protein
MFCHDCRASEVLEGSDDLGVGRGWQAKPLVLEFIEPVQDLINLIEVGFPEHFQVLPGLFQIEPALFLQEPEQII